MLPECRPAGLSPSAIPVLQGTWVALGSALAVQIINHATKDSPVPQGTREAAVAASIKNANIDRAIRRGVFNRYSVTPISFDQLVLLYVGDAHRMKPPLDWFS